jgi:large subunit ribosomal protein L9
MKIILQKPVERLGDPGDVAEVADGYARNYLIPRGLAVKAEKGTVRHAESLKRAHEVRTSAQKGDFEALAVRIIQTPVVVTARAGEEGKLFGSVTAADIAEALSAQAGVAIDRRDVHLGEPIRSIGMHEVTVHLHPEVDPVITVEVHPVDGQPPAVGSPDEQPREPRPEVQRKE